VAHDVCSLYATFSDRRQPKCTLCGPLYQTERAATVHGTSGSQALSFGCNFIRYPRLISADMPI
jgi:hypothetical protein